MTNDEHSHWISEHKLSLLSGAEKMRKAKKITAEQEKEIIALVNNNQEYLWPIICVIPFEKAKVYMKEVDASKKASKISNEYLAVDLPGDCFDVIKIKNAIPSVMLDEGGI